MRNALGKILKMLIGCLIVIAIALITTSILNIIYSLSPILFWVIQIVVLLYLGYHFGNDFIKLKK